MSTEHQSLIQLDKASRMLAEIHSVDDAKSIVDLAEAARVYARQVGLGLEAQNHAAEVKLRAQRRGGEILQQMEKRNGNLKKGPVLPAVEDGKSSLEELGITYNDSSRWQNIAKMPEEKFEEFIAETKSSGGEVTTAAALKVAAGQRIATNHGESDGDEWYTPDQYIEAARKVLGGIDLDPATSDAAQERIGAKKFYTKADDGLTKRWFGNVWMNPPYSYPLVEQFTSHAIKQYDKGNVKAAIILTNNCTDAAWFQSLLKRFPVCFTAGRVSFWQPNQTSFAARQGQVFFYMGASDLLFSKTFAEFGTVVRADA